MAIARPTQDTAIAVEESRPLDDGYEQALRHHAEQCQEGFINILHGLYRNDVIIKRLPQLFHQPIDGKPIFTINDLKDEFESFRVWASNIGVFASDHASLDYRLREATDVKQGIVRLLTSLNAGLVEILGLLKANQQYNDQSENHSQECSDDSSSESDVEELTDIEVTIWELQGHLEHVSDTIDKLSHLARVIRTSGVRSRTLRASNYIHLEDGVNQTEIFESDYLPLVLKHRFQVPDSLLTRLCQAISLRRRRFMFYRKHQKTLAAYNTVPSEVLQVTNLTPEPQLSQKEHDEPMHKTPAIMKRMPVEVRSGVTQPTRATTFRPTAYQKLVPSTMMVSTAKIAMGSTEIPPAPQPEPGGSHFQCPYCCLLVENKKASTIAWRKHVINDLQPFVCVEAECSDPDVVLETWTDWLEHHKWTHAMEWWCEGIDGDHEPTRFVAAEHYSEHLLNTHLSALSIRDVGRRLDSTGGPSQEPFRHCPFCSFRTDPVATNDNQDALSMARIQQVKLQSHIFEHLLSLFILALPERTDILELTSEAGSSNARRSSMSIGHHSFVLDLHSVISDTWYQSEQMPNPAGDPEVIGSNETKLASITFKRTNEQRTTFQCKFRHFGCLSTFSNKNEWKRHVLSQHLQLGFYRCDLGSCNPKNRTQLHSLRRKPSFAQSSAKATTTATGGGGSGSSGNRRPRQHNFVVLKYGKKNRKRVEALLRFPPRPRKDEFQADPLSSRNSDSDSDSDAVRVDNEDPTTPIKQNIGAESSENEDHTYSDEEECLSYNDFNRKDLFVQHCRRMHGPNRYKDDDSTATNKMIKARYRRESKLASKIIKTRVTKEDESAFEQELEGILLRCYVVRRRGPTKSRCGFCGRSFEVGNTNNDSAQRNYDMGGHVWDEMMEHVSRHYEGNGVSDQTESIDTDLMEWGLSESVLGYIVDNAGDQRPWLIGYGPPSIVLYQADASA